MNQLTDTNMDPLPIVEGEGEPLADKPPGTRPAIRRSRPRCS